MPAFLIPLLQMLAEMGGGLGAQLGIKALIERMAPSLISKLPSALTTGVVGKVAGAALPFTAEMIGFDQASHGIHDLLHRGKSEDVNDVDVATNTPYPNSKIDADGLDKMRQQASLRAALEQMGVSGLV